MVVHRDFRGPNVSGGLSSAEMDEVHPKSHGVDTIPDFQIDAKKRLVSVKFRNRVTIREIETYAAYLQASSLFEPDFSEIVDMSEVEELDLSAEEFIRLADKVDPFSADARRAFVVRNSVQSHAARMHKILRTQRNFSIFQSVEEARRWILSRAAAD